MSCPCCAKRSLVTIALRVGEHELTMHSCSACETRWWEREGESVALPSVLELAAKRR